MHSPACQFLAANSFNYTMSQRAFFFSALVHSTAIVKYAYIVYINFTCLEINVFLRKSEISVNYSSILHNRSLSADPRITALTLKITISGVDLQALAPSFAACLLENS